MAYVSVPKDLTKVKNKLVFNLTRRQLICFALAAAIGLPFYFLTREALGFFGYSVARPDVLSRRLAKDGPRKKERRK